MKITAVDTVWNPKWSNFIWVQIQTDEGLVGLGETFRHPTPIIRYIHDHIAEYLLGKDPLQVNLHAHTLHTKGGLRFLGYPTRSVEIRANSAIDIALWDLKSKAAGLSLCDMLGGSVRDKITIYNTCAGPSYNWKAGLSRARMAQAGEAAQPYDGVPDDLQTQLDDPASLAQSLIGEGIRAMKIWPFDQATEKTDGRYISGRDLNAGLEKVAAIRDAVGEDMEIMLEYHSLWQKAPAERIMRAVDQFDPFWHEDPMSMADIVGLADLRNRVSSPIAGSESHGSAVWFREAFASNAVDYAHFDIGWVGGLSEGLKIAHIASANGRMIAPHDCTGPVVWITNLHLALSQPHAIFLESVRAFYKGIYKSFVTELPEIVDGQALAMEGPGLGTQLSAELLEHPDTQIERSTQ